MSFRIFVDYNDYDTVDGKDRIPIYTHYPKGQAELVSQLVENMPIIIYDWDNLEFDAIAEFNEMYQCWYAIPDWSTRRDLPPLND